MRYSEMLVPRVLFTLVAVVCVGFAWGVMASRGARDGAQVREAGAVSALGQINRSVVVTGRIRPAVVNMVGDVDAVAIVVPRVGTFRIADSGKGRDLRDHVGDTVRVVATTRLDPDGKEILDVEDYSVGAL
jgi:hypothetical protein